MNEFISGQRHLDLGTGAGIPGIILAILNPRYHYTLFDRRDKVYGFVEHCNAILKLKQYKNQVRGELENMSNIKNIETVVIKNFSNKAVSSMMLLDRVNYIHKYLSNSLDGKFRMVSGLTGSRATFLATKKLLINDKHMASNVHHIENPYHSSIRDNV